ncbi:MAG: DUF2441 domain-containing protein [Treponema sp.]|nr:DUF2441 domain-containing protein [Treponema sp.]
MKYYHLVTRIPMKEGQIIDFTGDNNNRLYDFWMKREARREDGADVFKVLMEDDFSDAGKDVIKNYVFNQSRAVRETISELVRVTQFPDRPSRLKGLYVCKTLEEAKRWKANFESYNRKVLQLVELSSDGPCFTGDAALLPEVNGESFEKKIEQARHYWSGELKGDGDLVETLLGGVIKVEKIIEDYQ